MTNRLIHEQSLYLQQHAHNPVDWYPWGDDAFARAKSEHKPVIVSIGYAACHWCHVMEKESFEDAEVAAYMNAHFVCIKVDREEHPDVDHLYMDAVQAIGGSGGWPLNVFVTPERAPFYGGTYYPPRPAYNRPSWMQLLLRMNEIWEQQQEEVVRQSDQLLTHLRQASARAVSASPEAPGKDVCRKIAENLLQQADAEKGGFGHAPKFPGTMAISYLLEHYHFTKHEPSLRHALKSIDAMADGGIYDQAGGGFARYATDRNWLVPHFEKMLYDNALLVVTLCDAYQATGDDKYKRIALETIGFCERELLNAGGGYYCSLDADSEGVEGKFYTWTWDEWIEALGENDPVAETCLGVRREGNWEGTNILHRAVTTEEAAARFAITTVEVQRRVEDALKRLHTRREKRIRPLTDDKSLLSWNALMNMALSRAGAAFGGTEGDDLLARALRHMQWMTDAFDDDGVLCRVWKDGKAKIPAKIDDYAYLVRAMLQLGSSTGINSWIVRAASLTEDVIKMFGADDGLFYYTPEKQQDIPVRKVDVYDGATPSGNAVMAGNLLIAGMCFERSNWMDRGIKMLFERSATTARYSYSFAYWGQWLQRYLYGLKTAVCAGAGSDEMRREILSKYLPQAFPVTSGKEISELPIIEKKFFADKMHIFVCTMQACLSPVNSVTEALYLMATS